MEIIAALGAAFNAYGVDRDGDVELGWVKATWVPTKLACNPHGVVQAGVHSVILDAAMNFSINVGLDDGDRTRATLEMKTETMRAVGEGDDLVVRGHVVRLGRQVAYAEAAVYGADERMSSRATGTFLLHRGGR